MAYKPGICPKCQDYLLLKEGVPFLVCPMCGQSISNAEAAAKVDLRCGDPKQVNDIVADCIALEMEYGPELPFMILAKIVDNFPQLESPAYLLTKLTGYDFNAVRQYLQSFADIKSQPQNVPWAEEFLDRCLTYRNMEFAEYFAAYIENKVRPAKQAEYREKLAELRKEYTFKANDPRSTKTLFTLYIIASIVNVLLLPCFLLITGALGDLHLLSWGINIIMAIVIVCAEVGLMFWHQKVFGNRLGMPDKERLLMIIFMCSMIFALGSAVVGSIWAIKL